MSNTDIFLDSGKLRNHGNDKDQGHEIYIHNIHNIQEDIHLLFWSAPGKI